MLTYGFEYCDLPVRLDRVCRGYTPLHGFASGSSQGNVDKCDILLKNGADVNALDAEYYPSE